MELITVQKSQIGQNAVSTINAKDLHSKLEVKTRFDIWLNRAIDKYGFEINIDFCTNLNESNGGRPSKEYFVSLDMAKELCMLDDSKYGKQFRKYFIECENKSQKVLTNSEQIHLLAQGYTTIEKEVVAVKEDIELLKNDITLSSAQKRQLQISVNCKVASFNPDDTQKRKLYKKVWTKLYNHYAVSSYMEIPRLKFQEAKNLVDSLTLLDVAVG